MFGLGLVASVLLGLLLVWTSWAAIATLVEGARKLPAERKARAEAEALASERLREVRVLEHEARLLRREIANMRDGSYRGENHHEDEGQEDEREAAV